MKNSKNRNFAPTKESMVPARKNGASDPRNVVDVIADYRKDGSVMPREIAWSDGRTWPIEQITAVGAQPGGQFLRFTCQVRKQWVYLLMPAQLVS